tara:strand:- start:4673 stop:8563 length:3891 start_codon:yes stop_codon:yes gene_type:complete
MIDQSEQPYLLRAEAFPIARYGELTRNQRVGLRQLLLRLREAVQDLDQRWESPVVPTWLTNERFARLAFVDGQRGTGKTTLMATLVRLIVPDQNSTYFEDFNGTLEEGESIPVNDDLRRLARPLRDRIVVLEPLDMEPLPKSTPLLAAILARLSRAAREYDTGDKKPLGLLDPDLDDDRDFIRFQQFQAQIARALDSNLEDRRASLDREQYGQAVMEQEQDRLRLWSTLDEVLNHLSKAIGSNSGKGKRHLFLVPVDDVDLNPKRCLELLRLLRSYSPPQLYFMLMGQFDLVKSVVNLSMANEYDQVRPLKAVRHATPDKILERKIAEVAAANLQKMVPDVIKLPILSIEEIMEFRPPGMDSKSKSLRELFSQVIFHNTKALPGNVGNLADLLNYGRKQTASRNRNSSGIQAGDYPGLGSFRVSLRRLVDLYRHLDEALLEEKNHPQKGGSVKDPILEVFKQYWDRIVDEDPHLDPESRERLQKEGFTACEVITDCEEMVGSQYPINDTLVKINVTDQHNFVTYQPVISIADMELNDGIPLLRVSRTTVAHGERTIAHEEILDLRTRCAYVLLHDILVARIETRQEEPLEPIRATSPVAMVWRSESGKIVRIPWPLPRLQSFAKLTALYGEFSQILRDMNSDRAEGFQSMTQTQLEELVRAWIILGQNAILAKSQNKITRHSKWGDLVVWLVQYMNHRSNAQRNWCIQLVMLTSPETCAIDLAVKPCDIKRLSRKHQNAIEKLRSFSNDYLQELKGRRSGRFDVLWSDEFRDLWLHLNDRFNEDSWINLKLRQPTLRTRNDFTIALEEFGENFGENLENKLTSKLTDELTSELKETENRLAFEMELNSVRSLIQQGDSLLDSNAQSACRLLSSVIKQAEHLYARRTNETKVAHALIDAEELLGIAYFEMLSPRKAYEQYLRADDVITTLIQGEEDHEDLKQRRIELIISRSYPLFFIEKESDILKDIEKIINECREEMNSSPDDEFIWSRLYADALTVQGLTLRDYGQIESAENALRSAIDIFSSISVENSVESNFSIEWARSYLASVLFRKGDLEIAKLITTEERASAKTKVSQQVEDTDIQQLYLVTTELLGQILLFQGEANAAVQLMREAVAIAERVSLRNGTSLLRIRDLARIRLELARALRLAKSRRQTTNPLLEAHHVLQMALPDLERIDSIDPYGYRAALDLGTGYLELAKILLNLDDSQSAQDNLEKANEALNRAIEVEPNHGPVFLKMAELHWELSLLARNKKVISSHREAVENCLHSARHLNTYIYPEIQNIEEQLHNDPPSRRKN